MLAAQARLSQLLAWRLARRQPNTFSLSVNDFGLELLSVQPVDAAPLLDGSVFSSDPLLPDVLASLNSGALAQRRFREELSTEKLADRLARILAEAQAVLDEPAAAPTRRRKSA